MQKNIHIFCDFLKTSQIHINLTVTENCRGGKGGVKGGNMSPFSLPIFCLGLFQFSVYTTANTYTPYLNLEQGALPDAITLTERWVFQTERDRRVAWQCRLSPRRKVRCLSLGSQGRGHNRSDGEILCDVSFILTALQQHLTTVDRAEGTNLEDCRTWVLGAQLRGYLGAHVKWLTKDKSKHSGQKKKIIVLAPTLL